METDYEIAEYLEKQNMVNEGNEIPEYSHCHACGEKIDGEETTTIQGVDYHTACLLYRA